MIKRVRYILFLIIIGLAACTPSATTITAKTSINTSARPVAFTDASGFLVQLAQYPQRIVIEGKQAQMLVDFFYLFPDQSSKIVGIQKTMQTPDNFLLVIDSAAVDKLNLEQNASAEQVASLNPDMVILKSSMKQQLSAGFAAINVPVVYMDYEYPDQFTREITNLGIILNQEQRATEINSLFDDWEKQVVTKVTDLQNENKPKVLVIQYSDKNGAVAFSVPSSSFLQTTTVEMAGGIAMWKNEIQGSGWDTVGLEQIAAWDPDMIFVINYSGNSKDAVNKLIADPAWKQLKAVKNDHLYGFAGDFISWDQPDPRWVLGLNWLANKIHPDLVAFNTKSIVAKFYSDFYKLDSSIVNNKVMPLLKGDLP